MAKSWKDYLLKSGIPLEYQVARILSEKDMIVDADYSFLRRDVSGFKEWSVDVVGTWFGSSVPGDVDFELYTIVECKYRSPEKFILFLQEPNVDPDYDFPASPIVCFDHFSKKSVDEDVFFQMAHRMERVYKGLELYDGGAFEEDIRHGIQQLRYATPALARQALDFSIPSHADDRVPIFIAKILVTNVPLRVMGREVDIAQIQEASSAEDISASVDSVVMLSGVGPEYEEHVKSLFNEGYDQRREYALQIKEEVEKGGKNIGFYSDPVELVDGLSRASRYRCSNFGGKFFVSTLDGLPHLLSEIVDACILACDDQKAKA